MIPPAGFGGCLSIWHHLPPSKKRRVSGAISLDQQVEPSITSLQKPIKPFIEEDCARLNGQTLWKPTTRYELQAVEKSNIDFRASIEAMDQLNSYGFNIRFFNTIKISKIDATNLFFFDWDLKQKEVTKACLWMEETDPLFMSPIEDHQMKLVHLTLTSPKFVMKDIRFTFYGGNNHIFTRPELRKVGPINWYSANNSDDFTSKGIKKSNTLTSPTITELNKLFNEQGFSSNVAHVEEIFQNHDYLLSPYNDSTSSPYVSVETGNIIVSDSAITKAFWRSPLLGPNSWPNLTKAQVESAFSYAGLMLKFYQPFLNFYGLIKETDFPNIPDLPYLEKETKQWLFYYHLLEKEPRLDYLLFEKCKKQYRDAHLELYCKILKEHLTAKGRSYDSFVQEKFAEGQSYLKLSQYLPIMERLPLVTEFLQQARPIVVEIIRVARQDARSKIDLLNATISSASQFIAGVNVAKDLAYSLIVGSLNFQGLGHLDQYLNGEISQQEYDRRMESEPQEKQDQAKAILADIRKIESASASDIQAELDRSKKEAKDFVNPFDNPWEHMR